MKTEVYTIRDEVSKECSPFLSVANYETAKRAFSMFLQQAPFGQHSYVMYYLGSFDSEPESGSLPVLYSDVDSLGCSGSRITIGSSIYVPPASTFNENKEIKNEILSAESTNSGSAPQQV